MTDGVTPGAVVPGGSRLTDLEIACGYVFGFDDSCPSLDRRAGRSPRDALEAVIGDALARPPCIVSFSGGRDSSAVLAIATDVARRTGLPAPIPVTLRFPHDELADESEWQERIVRHLRLDDWQRLDFTDELDIVGPYARRALDRHGVVWPFNAFFHLPVFEHARGGSVLTGIGGDEVFSPGAWHAQNLVLSGRRKLRPLDPVRIGLAVSPWPARRRYLDFRIRHNNPDKPWLTAAAARVDGDQRDAMARRERLSFARTVQDGYWRRRGRILGAATLDMLAGEYDVRCTSPFSTSAGLGAIVGAQRWREYESRTAAMREVVGDLLPDAVLDRSSKASFGASMFSTHARRFVDSWDGEGLDEALVRRSVIERMWRDPATAPDARTFTLFQHTWLASRR